MDRGTQVPQKPIVARPDPKRLRVIYLHIRLVSQRLYSSDWFSPMSESYSNALQVSNLRFPEGGLSGGYPKEARKTMHCIPNVTRKISPAYEVLLVVS